MDGMAKYFPSTYPKGRMCNREYFFSILATVHPDYYENLVRTSKNARFGMEEEEQKKEAILMTQEWAEKLE